MKKTKTMMSCVTLLLIALIGCEVQTTSLALAKQIKVDVPAFESLTVGQVAVDSVQAYYADTALKWQDILANNPPQVYRKGIEAQKDIAIILNTLLHTNREQINMSYLGFASEDDSDVVGIFIYDFTGSDLGLLTADLFYEANMFTLESETGEYFHKVGNYIITCMHGLLENYQSLFDKIDTLVT